MDSLLNEPHGQRDRCAARDLSAGDKFDQLMNWLVGTLLVTAWAALVFFQAR
jgi:hypothetical protein